MQVRSMPEAVDTRAGMSAFSSTQQFMHATTQLQLLWHTVQEVQAVP